MELTIKTNIQRGQEMSIFALRVLIPRADYDELNRFYFESLENK